MLNRYKIGEMKNRVVIPRLGRCRMPTRACLAEPWLDVILNALIFIAENPKNRRQPHKAGRMVFRPAFPSIRLRFKPSSCWA